MSHTGEVNKVKVRLVLSQEVVALGHDSSILIFVGDELVAEVLPKIEYQHGADGGVYSCIKLVGNALSSEAEIEERRYP